LSSSLLIGLACGMAWLFIPLKMAVQKGLDKLWLGLNHLVCLAC